jgi:hypothetical protein
MERLVAPEHGVARLLDQLARRTRTSELEARLRRNEWMFSLP